MKYIVLSVIKMMSDVYIKLKRWGIADGFEKAEEEGVEKLARLRKSSSRLDMLLGSAVTSVIFSVALFLLKVTGAI